MGCDESIGNDILACVLFQSTHPVWGATTGPPGTGAAPRHFNPRTPCGVRLFPTRFPAAHRSISIHAPRVGCDPGSQHPAPCAPHFNPRTPCGVRHLDRKAQYSLDNFNPRTPCGVRRTPSTRISEYGYFNPRTPCGVRLSTYGQALEVAKISIHAPRVGCDD